MAAAEERPGFFKAVLPGFSRKLNMPRAYLKNLVGEKGNRATLKSPRGKSWTVKVEGNGDGMWFEDGWSDFAEEHDLRLGEMLVFRYEGDMVFNVTIFDKSAMEKEYPSEESSGMEEEMKGKGAKNIPAVKRECKHSKARKEEPERPYFSGMIGKCNVLHNYMRIPRNFYDQHCFSNRRMVILKDPKRRLWTVDIAFRRDRGAAFFRRGWKEFAASNGLKIGDTCIFGFTSATKDVMYVQIKRGAT